MTFTCTYRSSDGERHTARIEAANRDEAFARVRSEFGVKPIKLAVEDAEEPRQTRRGRPVRLIAAIAVPALAVAAAAIAWLAGRSGMPYPSGTPQGAVSYSPAVPLPRQAIPGSRMRIDDAKRAGDDTVFKYALERYLARYAEPGREAWREGEEAAPPADSEEALRKPLKVSSADFTETADLKRIVAGMKREMRAYMAGGGSAAQYFTELAKRQKLEMSYRENAKSRLDEMLSGAIRGNPRSRNAEAGLSKAYGYWLNANAQLKSMGIYEIPLPDALRPLQMHMDIDAAGD